MQENRKQLKHTVNYRNNDDEARLFAWIEQKGKIVGPVNFIKQVLYDKMQEENKK